MISRLVDHPWIEWGIVSFFIVDHIFLIDSERANDSLYILIDKNFMKIRTKNLVLLSLAQTLLILQNILSIHSNTFRR